MMNIKVKAIAKKVLPVMMVPVLLFGNYATITTYADDVDVSAVGDPTQTINNEKENLNPGDTTSIDGKAGGSTQAVEEPTPVEENGNIPTNQSVANTGEPTNQEGDNTEPIKEKGFDRLKTQNDQGVDGANILPAGVISFASTDNGLPKPENTGSDNPVPNTTKSKICNVEIKFDIENRAEGQLKLFLGDDEIEGDSYFFDVSEETETRDIVFNYQINGNYKLDNVSGGVVNADDKTITCSYADIKFENDDNENNAENNGESDPENNTENDDDDNVDANTEGNVPKFTFTFNAEVKKIDAEGPTIENPAINTEDGAAQYEGSNGAVIASSDNSKFVFTADVSDDSCIDKVYAIDSNNTELPMAKVEDGNGNGVYSWTPGYEKYRNYLITQVVAIDEWGNESTVDVTDVPTICYYSENEKSSIGVTEVDSSWRSYTQDSVVNINCNTIREVKEIIVKKNGADTPNISVSATQKEYKDGKHILSVSAYIPAEEGENNYDISCLFYGDEEPVQLATRTLRIDNTAPSAEIIVDGEDLVLPDRFFRDFKRGWFAANNDITVLIKVPKECDGESDEKAVSGFSGITYEVNGDTVTKTIDDAKSTDDDYVFEQKVYAAGKHDADWYAVQIVSICDVAGNVADHADKIKKGSLTKFVIDRTAPTIVYGIDGQVAQDKERLYFDGSARGKVTIEDIDLDVDSIKFKNEDGKVKYVVPSCNEKESDGLKKQVYDFLLENDGAYKIETTASDTLGQTFSLSSTEMVVDKTAPNIEISYDKEAPSADGNKYYPSNVQVTVKVKDTWLDKSRSFVYVKKTDTTGAEVSRSPINDWSGDLGDDDHVITYTTDGDGMYQISVEAYDMANNHDSMEGNKFGVDATVPEVTLTFDENDPHNDKYYDKVRTATLTVTDFSFNEEEAKLAIDENVGKASVGSWANTGLNVYTRMITFDQDGKYVLKFNCQDKAGNKSQEVSEKEFVIDRTEPEINVSYNSLTPGNGKYYKDTRIANVNIKEMSFDDKLVELAPQPLSDLGTMPSFNGFSSSDDKNVSQISFSEDGTYGYTIKCTDLAGNTATEYMSDVFVIDKTAPEVKFSGVENFSANNGEVAPTVVYGDKYIDIQASNVVLKGANNGTVNVGCSIKQIENGFAVSYSDFAHDKSMDDLYVLEATVRDMAGNQTKDELVFSVNRHGSVFVVGDVARKFNEKYYINAPKDITITEINIDELTQKDVSISRDGSIRELANGKDYSVSHQGSDTSWKTYTYTISKKNFYADGIYSVTVYTKDKASNIQDNKSRDAEITFAVDMTAPGIVTAGLEEGGVYKQDSLDFNVDVTDNMGVEKLTIYKDGEIVRSCSGEELEGEGGVETITLTESEERQSVTVIAQDLAGNKETLAIGGVLVSTKEVPVEKEDILGEKKEGPRKNNNTKNGLSFFVYALAAVAAMSVSGGAIYLLKVKSKVES